LIAGHHRGILRQIDADDEQLGHSHFTARPSSSDFVYLISQNFGQLGHDNPITLEPIAGSPIFCPQLHSNRPFDEALIILLPPNVRIQHLKYIEAILLSSFS